MGIFKRGRTPPAAVYTAPAGVRGHPFGELGRYVPLADGESRLYAALREAVPLIDAALDKTVRLAGGFCVRCEERAAQEGLRRFLQEVPVGACGQGVDAFLDAYLNQLLTFGTAVGELVPRRDGRGIAALYNADLEDIALRAGASPLAAEVCIKRTDGTLAPVPRPDLVLVSALRPRPGKLRGDSVLRGLPFVSGVLLKIYHSIGVNWERVGNVRFAVTCKPGADPGERAFARERAEQMAREWGRAMRGDGGVSDFVAVGDVDVRVIGADNQILDSAVPVRQLLEQIVAKLGIPPFLLGLSWSTTERMSSEQADMLTSELESYRRLLTPVIGRICSLWLRMNGFAERFAVEWQNINLQDEVELANARLRNAQAAEIEHRLGVKNNEEEGDLVCGADM
jgi:hypothetical protein